MTLDVGSGLRAVVLCLGVAIAPMAQSQTAQTAQTAVDAEDQLDEGLKGFGYLSGLALGCVAKEQRPLLEREVMDLNAELSRLLGIDRAFLFTAGFGHGSGVELKLEECKTVLSRYAARVAKFRQGRGGR